MIKNNKPRVLFDGNEFICENNDLSRKLYSSGFGVDNEFGGINFSCYEAVFLYEKKRVEIFDSKSKPIEYEKLFAALSRKVKDFRAKFLVFRDLSIRGYRVKTGLKFGGDFRVYDKGKSVNDVHARWVVYVTRENKRFSWHEFASKNRVAHSTRKKVLIAIVDEELNVSYYEVKWTKV